MKKQRLQRYFCLTLALIILVPLMAACGGTANESTTGTTAVGTATTSKGVNSGEQLEQVELSFLSCWNGSGSLFPQDQVNNPIAEELRKKTGVTLKLESITTNETEKLNTMFAAGVLPDIVNAPCWSTINPGEGAVIKKAAMEGQILALNPYLDKYPNVKRMTEVGLAKDFKQYEMDSPDFKWNKYLLPIHSQDGTPESITKWTEGIYARGDILKALNINPEDIDTTDEVYELLKKIKNGNFKDISGKPVIPAGTMHNGWSYSQYIKGWKDKNISDYREQDGKLTYWTLSKDYEEITIFMRKLLKEGLFDPEAFSNTDTMANEKLAVGKLATFGAQDVISTLSTTLYKTNPEMKYELLGPIKNNKSGKNIGQVEKLGVTGSGVLFLSANIKNADAALRLIDYINSDEGRLLAYFGVEGKHYTMDNNEPKMKPEVLENFKNNADAKREEGMLLLMDQFISGFNPRVKWPKPESEMTQYEKWHEEYLAKIELTVVDKISANYIALDWPKYQQFKDTTATLNFDKELKKAFFAATDAEALDILHKIQDRFRAAGAQEMADYVSQKANGRDDVGY